MCGIAGAITNDPNDLMIVESIIRSQHSRGPDFSKIDKLSKDAYLLFMGHNRLSINDLSDSSNQPFWDSTGSFCLVFNGEIYNYKEIRSELVAMGESIKTSGDTEILMLSLIKWGKDALNKLNGMFAFCFVDLNRRTLLFARDRFGKKPLYYKLQKDKLFFASTASELASQTESMPNLQYIANGLISWVYENGSDSSQYQGVKSLPGGSAMEINFRNNSLEVILFKFYELKRVIAERDKYTGSYELAKMQLFELLQDAIKIRLRSDVPVAVALSGGLDSSSIAAIAKSYNSNIEALTFGALGQKQSEGPLVDKLAKHLGIKVNYVWPNIEQVKNAFDNCIDNQDSPILSLSYIAEFLVYQQARDLGFKVMLGGQGGDETFMGYRKYQVYKLLDDITERNYSSAFIQGLNLIRILKNEVFQISRYLKSLKRISQKRDLHTVLNIKLDDASINLGDFQKLSPMYRQVYDICEVSVPVQVKSEDRNSMASSIETRAPFLDYRVVEFGISLPQNFKIKNGYGKWILRDVMKGYIPDEIRLARYKRGYDMSNDWIGMGLGSHIRQKLIDNEHAIQKFLKNRIDINYFSDSYLTNNINAIQEVSTLLWLCKKYN
jgi:asparagine synthase (glutamine-hydrolysing)